MSTPADSSRVVSEIAAKQAATKSAVNTRNQLGGFLAGLLLVVGLLGAAMVGVNEVTKESHVVNGVRQDLLGNPVATSQAVKEVALEDLNKMSPGEIQAMEHLRISGTGFEGLNDGTEYFLPIAQVAATKTDGGQEVQFSFGIVGDGTQAQPVSMTVTSDEVEMVIRTLDAGAEDAEETGERRQLGSGENWQFRGVKWPQVVGSDRRLWGPGGRSGVHMTYVPALRIR